MAKFITGKELGEAVYDIIWDAKNTLLIVSPFIKLDDYFKKIFDHHANNTDLHIIIIFGKNEKSVSKSLSRSDFDFFKKFLKVSIIYVPNLHGKYYGNESTGVITSINLYDYSFHNNTEFGVLSQVNLFTNFTKTVENDAWNFCWELANENDVVFIKRPMFQKKFLSSILGRNYIKSDTLLDNTDTFYSTLNKSKLVRKRLNDFQDELELGSDSSIRPEREEFANPVNGYCIRTGVKIKFNPKSPYSLSAYKNWLEYNDRNPNCPEKYCHKTGQLSKGKTSFNNPILQ